MTRLDRFHLIAGVLGLVVDIGALITWLWGGSSAQPVSLSSGVLLVILVYVWASLSWFVMRYFFVHVRAKKTASVWSDVVSRTVTGVGLFLLPIAYAIVFHGAREEDLFGAIFGVPFVGFFIGIGVGGALYFLVPMIHPDMGPTRR